jgi:hypothetical protein
MMKILMKKIGMLNGLLFLTITVFSQVIPKEEVVETETLIFPMQGDHVHGSSIVALPNGDFLTAWFQGSGERTADDVKIMGPGLEKKTRNGEHRFCWRIRRTFLTAIRFYS